jgi:hypothetical protein
MTQPEHAAIQHVVNQLMMDAVKRKRNVRIRMRDMFPLDKWTSYPSRGPRLPNGYACIRYLLWSRAKAQHMAAHQRLSALIRATGVKPSKP